MFMSAAFALLPALALAAPTGVAEGDVPVLEDASMALSEADGRLSVEVITSLPLFDEDVRAKADGRILAVYLQGAVIGAKKSFGEGAEIIRALPRATYTKLEIPMPAGLSCGGPSITLDESIARVSFGCRPALAAAKPVVAKPVVASTPAEKPVEKAAPPAPVAKVEAPKPEAPKAEAPKPSINELIAAYAAPGKQAPAAAAPPAPSAGSVLDATPNDKEVVAIDKKPATASPLPARAPEMPSPFMAGGALAALAVVAFFLWRRRRAQQQGLIRILETASLGPKRALVVAEVDGEKMILGTSEAGISVLTPAGRLVGGFGPNGPWGEQTMARHVVLPPGMGDDAPVAHTPTKTTDLNRIMANAHKAAPAAVQVAESDILVEENEGGLLARLFRRKPEQMESDEGLGNMEEEFRDLLADSIEDEELRRRLAAGLGGRTS